MSAERQQMGNILCYYR